MLLVATRRGRVIDAARKIAIETINSVVLEVDMLTTNVCSGSWPWQSGIALSIYDAAYLELAVRSALPIASLDKLLISAAEIGRYRCSAYERPLRVSRLPRPDGCMSAISGRRCTISLFALKHGAAPAEDCTTTDAGRSTAEYDQAIRTTSLLGLHPDAIHRQSERFELYEREFEKLRDAGHVYACYETPKSWTCAARSCSGAAAADLRAAGARLRPTARPRAALAFPARP